MTTDIQSQWRREGLALGEAQNDMEITGHTSKIAQNMAYTYTSSYNKCYTRFTFFSKMKNALILTVVRKILKIFHIRNCTIYDLSKRSL